MTGERGALDAGAAPVNPDAANGAAARKASPAKEAGKEASSAEDSDATARSTSEEASQPSQRYGLRPKRSRPARESSPAEEEADSRDEKEALGGKAEEDAAPGGNKRRKRSGKQSDNSKQDGLLRLAQIAHANPRLPRTQRGEKEAEGSGKIVDPTAAQAAADIPAEGAAPSQQGLEAQEAPQPGGPASDAVAAIQQAALLNETKFTPAQIRALATAGQLSLPGYHPVPCPYVQAGARWQLDLRTGERLEEQAAPPLGGVPLIHTIPGLQNAGNGAGFPIVAGNPLGPRPPIFTAPGLQGAQGPPPGGYGIVPPANTYGGPLSIPSLGQQPLTQGLPAAGPYTALLGPQMQPLLPPGVLPHGQFPPGFAGMPHGGAALLSQQAGTPQPKKRQRSSHAAELADLPEIPLRRRGRPAGDGSAASASPQELQERRMQANRAAASRSHFRRKREMEILEKECATMETRVLELRNAVANFMAQEENLRLQQAGIREHLALGCKPEARGAAEAQQQVPTAAQEQPAAATAEAPGGSEQVEEGEPVKTESVTA